MKVWITRSRPGADRHEQVLQAGGYETLVLPVLAIDALNNPAPERDFDLVIFLSEHAVHCSRAARARTDFCAGARVLAVGASTAAALKEAGISVSLPEDRRGAKLQGSERLLASTDLQAVKGRSILIVCGEGGRMLLADTLRRRGAEVQQLRCYRRRSAGIRLESTSDIDAILVGSGDGFAYVARVWFEAGGDPEVAVLAPSARVTDLGAGLGFRRVINCAGAGAEDYLDALNALKAP